MGKEARNKNYRHKNQNPYKKDGWKNNRNQRGNTNTHGGRRFDKQEQHDRKQQNTQPKVSLREDQVGITEYVSSTDGFTGIVKSRFSDFHVNEIDLNGKVLQLDDLKIPKQVEETLNADELAMAKEQLKGVITPEIWAEIKQLAEVKVDFKDKLPAPIEIEVTALDKEQRTQIHKMLKKLYEGKLVSTTISKELTSQEAGEKQEQKFIKIMKPKGGRDQNRHTWNFPGEYVHFLMHKENMDTSEVAVAMAMRLNLRPSQVNYCGTKDKRAKTTQKFCIKKRTPSQIVNAVNAFHHVHIGNFEFSNEVLKLGQLQGNRFRIALRHINAEQEKIETALQQLRERGFINYFGLQRFGNCASIPTYDVGVALLKCDYKLACELILKPRDNDLHFMREIRETWWKNRNSKEAADMFRKDQFIEKKLLDGLAQYGEHDYASALRKIPRNMLLLYTHAFQSLIFNQMASRRLKDYGLQLIPGDLVYRNKEEVDLDISVIADIEAADNDDSDVEKETTENPRNSSPDENTESIFKRKVKALTSDDIASGNYTLFDIVLPLPGYDVTYPNNAVGTWYEETLNSYGLCSEKLKHNVKTYALAGAYRKMFIQPSEMSWKFCNYTKAEDTLILSDWELLKNKQVINASDEGKLKALILDFHLPTSTYATMMLRELLKTDTSATTQTQLEQNELKKIEEIANNVMKESTAIIEDAQETTNEPLVAEKRKAEVGEKTIVNAEVEQDKATEAKKLKICENLEKVE